MKTRKAMFVRGEKVEFVVTGEQTHGAMVVLIQWSPPGGGPPLHRHAREDELLLVLEGSFSVFNGEGWIALNVGDTFFARRGAFHTFRNYGDDIGRMLAVAVPAGLERYLEALSRIELPRDADKARDLAADYDIEILA